MPQRSSTMQHPADTKNSKARATSIVPTQSKSPAAPSLESLLKSCGALQSVIRQKSETDEIQDLDPECDPDVASHDLSATPYQSDSRLCHAETSDEQCAADDERNRDTATTSNPIPAVSPQGTGLTKESENSVNLLTILKLMREESRASIQELKASQEAAAAGQSAVLKALFEVISRSTAARDNVGETIEQQLIDFEERILHRIGHVSNTAATARPQEAKPEQHAQASVSAHAKGSSGRSWEQIRNDLLLHGDARETSVETDIREAQDLADLKAQIKSNSEASATILEVPEILNPDELSEEELRAVFVEREEFISTLISRLRQSHQQSSGHLPAEKLKAMEDFLPEDLAAKVVQSLQQLDELARIGELELSLERARLGRQVRKLEESRLLLEHHARQLGVTLTDDGSVSNPQKSSKGGTSSRRWLSKLGFGQ